MKRSYLGRKLTRLPLITLVGLVIGLSFSFMGVGSFDLGVDAWKAHATMPPKPGTHKFVSKGVVRSMSTGKLIRPTRSEPAELKPWALRGATKVLVLLLDFPITKFTDGHDETYWDRMLFDPGNPQSMYSYYYEVSYGTFFVSGDFTPVITSSKPMSYWGADSPGGYTDSANGPIHEMVRDAVLRADAVVDFSQYDSDGDGVVDHLIVIHAGPGQEGGASDNAIWSHRGMIAGGGQMTADGVRVVGYTTEPDDGQVGVFAHEFGHDLGLPDLYDRDYSSQGVGDWEIMSSGSWAGDPPGTRPTHFSAWSKVQLGWVDVINVAENQLSLEIPPVEEKPVVFRLWTDGARGQEYFLVENRQALGFDRSLPGSGLLIYHVDESVGTRQNDDETHYLVALEQADGKKGLESGLSTGDAGDPFPGTANNHTFAADTNPSARAYSGAETGILLSGITIGTDGRGAAVVNVASAAVPDRPVTMAPVGKQDRLRPHFRWSAVSGAAGYHLQVAGDAGFAAESITIDHQGEDLAKSSYTPTFDLPADRRLYWRVRALNYQGYGEWSSSAAFDTPRPGLALLVYDSEETQDYERYYVEALKAIGLEYNVWNTKEAGTVSKDVLSRYLVVLWAVPWQSASLWNMDGENKEALAAIADYLAAGGRLFLSGQDIGWALDFFGDSQGLLGLVGAEFVADSSHRTRVKGVAGGPFAGLDLRIAGGDGASNQMFPDVVNPANGAVPVWQYEVEDEDERTKTIGSPATLVGGLMRESSVGGGPFYRVIYSSFGFEAIAGAKERAEVMRRAVGWLLDRQGTPAAEVKGLTVAPPVVTPDGDGKDEELILSYELTGPANVTILIKTVYDAVVGTIRASEAQRAGTYVIKERLLNDRGIALPAGDYFLEVRARDAFTQLETVSRTGVRVAGTVGAITSVVAGEDGEARFSPNRDGVKDRLPLTVELAMPATVSVMIFDEPGRAVAMPVRDLAGRVGGNVLDWDGTGAAGELLPDGKYAVQISAKTDRGVGLARIDAWIDVKRPALESFSVNPLKASLQPQTSSFGPKSVKVQYELTEGAIVDIHIRDMAGQVIATLKSGAQEGPGIATASWDGLTDAGQVASDGNYEVLAQAVDAAGNRSEPKVIAVSIDNTPVDTEIASVEPRSISPNGDGFKDTAEIAFSLGEDSIATVVRVVDITSGTWVATLEHDLKPLAAGTYTVTWDGKANVGNASTTGMLYVLVRSFDEAWNMKQVLKRIYVDTIGPSITELKVSPASITPNGDQINDKATVSFRAWEDLLVGLTITDNDGKVVRRLRTLPSGVAVSGGTGEKPGSSQESVFEPRVTAEVPRGAKAGQLDFIPVFSVNYPAEVTRPGLAEFIWDGLDDSGRAVAEGEYTVEVVVCDLVGNVVGPTVVSIKALTTASELIGPAGGAVALGDGTLVIAPGGALAGETDVAVKALAPAQVPTGGAVTANGAAPQELGIGRVLTFAGLRSGRKLTLFIPYPDEDGDNRVDGKGAFVNSLAIYQWEESAESLLDLGTKRAFAGSILIAGSAGRWKPIDGARLDRGNRVLSAEIDKPGIYAVMAGGATVQELKTSLVRDLSFTANPFSPDGDGHKDFTQIRFLLLKPAEYTLEVFDSNGDLVVTLVRGMKGGTGLMAETWDGRVTLGVTAAPGLYLVRVSAKDENGRVGRITKLLGIAPSKGK